MRLFRFIKSPNVADSSIHHHEPWHRRLKFWVVLLLLIILGVLGWHFWEASDKTHPHRPTIPVVLATVQSQNVPVYASALGSVIPNITVTVRTQINGQLQKVLFTEGQIVKAGDEIAEIDSRPYLAQLMQYEGQLERDQALLANAKTDLSRYQKLWKENSIAQQILITQQSLVTQYAGAIKIDAGLIAGIKVNIAYCHISSPINGRIGLQFVDQGNYVQTSDSNGIAVITELAPIDVIFTLPEDQIPTLIPAVLAHQALTVEVYDRTQTHLLDTGKLQTMDNEIDPTTGTVKFKAKFPNAHSSLFPNQFVNVKLLITTLQHATTMPTAGLQYNTTGTYTYIYDPQTHRVKMQYVTATVTSGDNTVITAGLTAGTQVVIEGADKLTDGDKVELPVISTATDQSTESAKPTLTTKKRHHSS